jgi:creatinine amidohydrolase
VTLAVPTDTAKAAVAAPLRMKEMLPAELAAAVVADPRLIVPVGTCEPHGPHLPLGCDTMIVERLADDLSAEFRVVRAPTMEYGVNVAPGSRNASGAASLRKKTLHRTLNDLIDAWETDGFREFILLTAHQYDPHQEAMATVVTSGARVRVVDMFAMNLSELLEGQREAMHGDEVDTSLMLHLFPNLVRMDLAQDYMMSREELRRYRRGWLRVPEASAGSIGRPSLASADKGRKLYEHIRRQVSERIFRAPASSDD